MTDNDMSKPVSLNEAPKGRVCINYEMEYERLREKCAELEFEIKQLVDEREYYIRELGEKEKVMAGLEGQIKAFQFCVARGNLKNDR